MTDVDEFLYFRPSGEFARWSWLCYVLQEDSTSSPTLPKSAAAALVRPRDGSAPAGTRPAGSRSRRTSLVIARRPSRTRWSAGKSLEAAAGAARPRASRPSTRIGRGPSPTTRAATRASRAATRAEPASKSSGRLGRSFAAAARGRRPPYRDAPKYLREYARRERRRYAPPVCAKVLARAKCVVKQGTHYVVETRKEGCESLYTPEGAGRGVAAPRGVCSDDEVAATPRPRRGYSAETTPRRRRGYSAETRDGSGPAAATR